MSISNPQEIRILLVEDDEDLAELTAEYLQRHGYQIDIEHNGRTAIDRILTEQPDLVLLDIMLPGADGLEVCKQVRKQYRGAIMMLTARDEQIDEILGLEIGADDYLTKTCEPRLVAARIKALLRRVQEPQPSKQSQQLQFGTLIINNAARSVMVSGSEIELTNPEYDLLWFLANHAGGILSRELIFSELRGIEYDGQNRIIDITISQIRTKIGEEAFRIKTVRNKGYLFIEQ